MIKNSKNSLIDLIHKRIFELDIEIEKANDNGAYSTKKHLTRARNKNLEILFCIENGGEFRKGDDDENEHS